MKGILLIAVVAVLVAAPIPAQDSAGTSGAELREIFEQDQAARSPGGNLSQSDDEARVRRVLELLAAGEISTPEDRFHAAVVLQHTPRTWCRTRSHLPPTHGPLMNKPHPTACPKWETV